MRVERQKPKWWDEVADPDEYSPAYQDEYRRLWHQAVAKSKRLELDKVKAERDRIEQLGREKMTERDEARERVESLDDACRKVEHKLQHEIKVREDIAASQQHALARAKKAEADNERLREALLPEADNLCFQLGQVLKDAKVLGDTMDAPVRFREDIEAVTYDSMLGLIERYKNARSLSSSSDTKEGAP